MWDQHQLLSVLKRNSFSARYAQLCDVLEVGDPNYSPHLGQFVESALNLSPHMNYEHAAAFRYGLDGTEWMYVLVRPYPGTNRVCGLLGLMCPETDSQRMKVLAGGYFDQLHAQLNSPPPLSETEGTFQSEPDFGIAIGDRQGLVALMDFGLAVFHEVYARLIQDPT